MTDSHAVRLSSEGLPSTTLPEEERELLESLSRARESESPLAHVAELVANHPRSLACWSTMGRLGGTSVERYAYFRVGYHRGLDALRQNGWRGSGYVRWSAPSNVWFLRCLLGLARCAEEIGEVDEADRCRTFLAQLDPNGIPDGE